MRVAIVHDWLFGMRGGERCLEEFCRLFPEADIFTLFYSAEHISPAIVAHHPEQSVLGYLPGVRRYYRLLLPLYPLGIFDLSKKMRGKGRYDLVISISHCAAKNIVVPPEAFHLCYCLTPMRYLYDQYAVYFQDHLLEPLIRRITARLRNWDIRGAAAVSHFAAISEFVAGRIKNYYQRKASVIYPPVRTSWITPRLEGECGEGFLVVSALVPYKNVKLIVETFSTLLAEKLTVVGTGPEEKKLRNLAGPNVSFIDHVTDSELARLYRRSKALVFAAEEDFGMTPVESLAAGRPVIAYGRGGVCETVENQAGMHNGVLFSELSAQALAGAVHYFLDHEPDYTVESCLKQASKFSVQIFDNSVSRLLEELGIGDVKEARASL